MNVEQKALNLLYLSFTNIFVNNWSIEIGL